MPYGIQEEEESQRDVKRVDSSFQSVMEESLDVNAFPTEAWEFGPQSDDEPTLRLIPPRRIHTTGLAYALSGGNYTILDDDCYSYILVTTAATDRTVTLPTAADNQGRIIRIMKVDSGAGDVDVTPEGTDKINAYNENWKINDQFQYVVLLGTATGWLVLDALGTYLEWTTTSTLYGGTTSGIWYKLTGAELTVTPGRWRVGFNSQSHCYDDSTSGWIQSFLSLAKSAATKYQPIMAGHGWYQSHATTGMVVLYTSHRNAIEELAANTTFHLNIRGFSSAGGLTYQYVSEETKIWARRIA